MNILVDVANIKPSSVQSLIPAVTGLFIRMVMDAKLREDATYLYCDVPSPWLQIKCMKFLQIYGDNLPASKSFSHSLFVR